jgi:hypothetical protein
MDLAPLPHAMKFITRSLFLFLIIAAVFVARVYSLASQNKEPSSTPEIELCPYQTPEEWQEFLDHYSDDEDWVKTCEDSACDDKYYQFVKKNVEGIFEKCKSFISQHETIAQCTHNMRRFTPIWLKQHDSQSYGFLVDNPTYLAEQEAPDKPSGMMRIPDTIIAALPDLKRVEKAARENGFKYLTHDSALGGYRTFIFIPDPQGRFDQWMLLNLQNGESTIKKETPFSILTVQKADAAGQRFPRVRLRFRDYTIVPARPGYKLMLNESNNGKCYSCHTNGVRQLIARHTPILEAEPVRGETVSDTQDFAFRRLMEFNRKLRSYGRPDWGGEVIPENNGPMLGKEQNCTDCHNGESRAALTVLTSTNQLERKIYHELSMPPDTALPALIERKEFNPRGFTPEAAASLREAFGAHAAMARNFESSRLPALKEWFLEKSCR